MDLKAQKRKRVIISAIIIGGVVAAGIVYLAKYRFLPPPNPTIPPIIIKPNRSTLEIEYRQKMEDPPPISQKVYKIDSFNPVKEIDIQYSDSNNSKTSFNHSYLPRLGVRVEIWLQQMNSQTPVEWEWVDPDPLNSQITIHGYETDFKVEVKTPGHRLTDEVNIGNIFRPRYKREYEGAAGNFYRLGKIVIYNNNQPNTPVEYQSNPSDQQDFRDQYTLGFHKQP